MFVFKAPSRELIKELKLLDNCITYFNHCFPPFQQLISVHEQLSKLTGESVIVTNKPKKKPEKKAPKKETKHVAPPQPKAPPKQKSSAKAQVAQPQPKAEKTAKKQSASKRSANSK